MIGRKGKPSNKPKSSAETLIEALKEVQEQQERKERRRARSKRFAWLRDAPGWVKTTLMGVLIVLLILLFDGIRREGKEFNATLAAFNGQVMVTPKGESRAIPSQPNMTLRDKDVITTGANSTATVVFPDGSAIQLEPNTQFEVRLLDFARGGVRDRSFMVRAGAAVTRISQFFGAKSEATVCTPTAVAAVRGTAFRVAYDPRTKQSLLQVVDGSVQFRTATMNTESRLGQSTTASGYQLQSSQTLSQQAQLAVGNQARLLSQHEKPPNVLQRIEWGLTNLLDPILQLLGLGPGSWGYNSTNFARRTTCVEGLRRLRIHIEEMPGEDAPDVLNPVTLEELQLHPRERDRILSAFAGNMLLSYRKIGKSNYVVRVRARDKAHTLYELNQAEIVAVKE
jgi:ferric-dicitrate binding protein FerR (iron transport regulator)